MSNTAIGSNALQANLTGSYHTAVGYYALYGNNSGSSNTAFGYIAGSQYLTNESNNISIGANVLGATGESTVTRIGATATMQKCFISGIYGTISAGINTSVLIDAQGQLGTSDLTDGQLLIGSSGSTPAAATISPGTGIFVTNSSGSIAISSIGGGLSWSAVSASMTATANCGYIVTSGATVSIGLPTVSSIGSAFSVILDSGNEVSITQDVGQSIRFGSTVTTNGVAGKLISTAQGNDLSAICTVANTAWVVYGPWNTWTVV